MKQKYYLYKTATHHIINFHFRYYRAIVTDIISYNEIQLFYVDFGDCGTTSRENIFFITTEFLLLPFQAIECELVGITAAHGGWTALATAFLDELSRNDLGDMRILQLKVNINCSFINVNEIRNIHGVHNALMMSVNHHQSSNVIASLSSLFQ